MKRGKILWLRRSKKLKCRLTLFEGDGLGLGYFMGQVSIAQAMHIALEHHQAGRLAAAEDLYRQVLRTDSNHAGALHLLGVAEYQHGHREQALELIHRAVLVQPDYAEAYSNLARVLTDAGRLDDAIASCGRAIALKPSCIEAHNNLGIALQKAGKCAEAIACFERALTANPQHVDTLNNLGNALKAQDLIDAAIECYRRAIAVNPHYAQAHYNLALAYRENGQRRLAIEHFRHTLALRPTDAETHNNLGVALQEERQFDLAIAHYHEALRHRPDHADTFNNIGNALTKLGHWDEALRCYHKALELKPDDCLILTNIGSAYKEKGDLDAAIACSRRAIQLKPDCSPAQSNLIFAMHLHPSYDASAIRAEQQSWNDHHARPLCTAAPHFANERDPHRRLRIGYVSPDFRDHIVGLNLLPLLGSHNHRDFDIVCYANVPVPDHLTRRFQTWSDDWRDITHLSDERVAMMVREDKIDILVDLALHTAGNRLPVFARQPAPIQMTFAGYPGSTGLETIQYRLTDPYLEPENGDDLFWSEAPYRLPHSFWCYQTPEIPSMVSELPASRKGHVTLGCLNSFCKINEPTMKLWAAVMHAIPDSQLLLLAPEGDHRERVVNVLRDAGIEGARISFVTRRAHDAYLKLFHEIDIGLDTSPYNGHTTTLDALWMGVPVVTLPGRLPVSRAGASHLMNLGMPELIARDEADYVEIVRRLSADLVRLASLRADLRPSMQQSPLMDAAGFAKGTEAAYRDVWQRWCAVAPP